MEVDFIADDEEVCIRDALTEARPDVSLLAAGTEEDTCGDEDSREAVPICSVAVGAIVAADALAGALGKGPSASFGALVRGSSAFTGALGDGPFAFMGVLFSGPCALTGVLGTAPSAFTGAADGCLLLITVCIESAVLTGVNDSDCAAWCLTGGSASGAALAGETSTDCAC